MTSTGLAGLAAHASRNVPIVRPDVTAGAALAAIAQRRYECADDIVVLGGEQLMGIVPVERLLGAASQTPIAELMDHDPPTVRQGADPETAAWIMVERSEAGLSVVDGEGRFLGLIAPPRLIAALLEAHDEDLARLGGYLASTQRARMAAEERIARRLWHRLPWLLVGLAGAMLSALLVGAFEEPLERNVLLAFFVPAVVYMADAVGTQTETLLIRGMAAGVSLRHVVRRELGTGVVIGAIVAGAFVPFALAAWGDERVAVAVALALLASCSIATLVAMALPAIFARLGRDPAFGSGPLATVTQDLLSIAVYFAVALPIVE